MIKQGSRLDSYFPDIQRRGGDIHDLGENEPIIRTISKAIDEGEAREIDGIHFLIDSTQEQSGVEKAKRRLSLSLADRRQGN